MPSSPSRRRTLAPVPDRHGALHHDRVLGPRRAAPRSRPRRARGRRRPSRSAACPRTRTAAARARAPARASVSKCRRSELRGDQLRQAGLVDRDVARCAGVSIFAASMSRHQTSWPSSAKQAAVTRPTQPTPITPIGGLSVMPHIIGRMSRRPDYRRPGRASARRPASPSRRAFWSRVLEIQYAPRSVFQPTSRRRSPL